MNRLSGIDKLTNRFFAMRHGNSLANQQGIIVSHPENGCDQFGLSELGSNQVRTSLQQNKYLDSNTIIVSSDFKRARESAGIAHELLACKTPVCLDQRLRERDFGELELTADSGYEDVWCEDELNPDSQPRGVESVNRVMVRVTTVVADFEDRYSNSTILLVSHGDALQILQTAFARQCGSAHRQQTHLHTAEIRQLVLADQI